MALVKNGVPFDTAFAMDDETRAALCIITGELNGSRWNWKIMDWETENA
jgi:hypothetical protein